MPETLKTKTTYQIKLPSNIEIIVHEDAGGQYVVMNVQPSDASVYVDDMLEVMNGGEFSKMLRYGDHTYRVEHPLYEAKSGTFTIKNKKELIEIKLVPAYGYLSFTSTPADAEITVNGKVLGRTPFKSEALREGTYHVKTSLSSYSVNERDVIVVRGQTTEVAIPLSATFGYMEVNTVPEQGADVYINGMKVGKTPYRSDKLTAGAYKVKVMQSMYGPQEKEVQIVNGQTQQIPFNMAASFADVTIRAEQPQAEIYVNGEKKGIGLWKGRLMEGLYQLASRTKNHRDGTKSVEIKAGINQEIIIPAPTAVYGTLNISSNPVGGAIKIDGKEVGHTPDIISEVLVGERKVEVVKEGCASFTQMVVIEEAKIKELNVNFSQGEEVTIDAYAPANIEIDGVNYGKTPFKGMLAYGKHALVANPLLTGLYVHDTLIVTESSSKELFIRNGKFDKPYSRIQINGVGYSFSVSLSQADKVDGIFAYDYYTCQRYALPIPNYLSSLSSIFLGDIQGCFVLDGYAWINGKWKGIKNFSGRFGEKHCINTYKGHGYLYTVAHFQDHFEIIIRDILSDKDQILFSYNTQLEPRGEIKFINDNHLQYKGDFWTKDKKGNIKNKKEGFAFYIRTDSLPLPPLMSGSSLMDKKNVKEGQREDLDNKIRTQIDWKTFPGGTRVDNNVYIINTNAYVVVENVVREARKDFSDYYRDKHTVFLYKYDLRKKEWSLCAPYDALEKTSEWKRKSEPNLPLYRVYVRNETLMFDSRYQYDTRINRWRDFSNL